MCRMPGLLETEDIALYNKKFLYAGDSTAARHLTPVCSHAHQDAEHIRGAPQWPRSSSASSCLRCWAAQRRRSTRPGPMASRWRCSSMSQQISPAATSIR